MLEKYMYLWMWKSCIKSLMCDAGVALEQILKYIAARYWYIRLKIFSLFLWKRIKLTDGSSLREYS